MTGRMDGMDADGEWSDDSDDGVKSGSATAMSENDVEDDPIGKQNITIVTTTTLMHRDPVHAILDKIDAELGSIHTREKSQQKPNHVSKKHGMAQSNRVKLEAEGVMFDTADEIEKEKLGVPVTGSDRDTGLGTGSLQDDTVPDSDHQKIVGSAQIYSDVAEMTDDDGGHRADDHHSDLDSLAAQQIDEKFKEIMRKKRGGYLDGLKAPVSASDLASIKTEDFEEKFKETLVGNRKCVAASRTRNRRQQHQTSPVHTCVLVSYSLSNTSQQGPGDLPPHSKSVHVSGQTAMSKPRASVTFSSFKMSAGYGSDFGSVKTEDFESRFQDLIVKQPAAGTRPQTKPVKPVKSVPVKKTLPAMPPTFSPLKSESSHGINSRSFIDSSFKESSTKKTKPVTTHEETSRKVRALPTPHFQDRISSLSHFHDNRTTSSTDGSTILRPKSVSPSLFRKRQVHQLSSEDLFYKNATNNPWDYEPWQNSEKVCNSSSSVGSTFDEVESLCLSKSSTSVDSNQYNQQCRSMDLANYNPFSTSFNFNQYGPQLLSYDKSLSEHFGDVGCEDIENIKDTDTLFRRVLGLKHKFPSAKDIKRHHETNSRNSLSDLSESTDSHRGSDRGRDLIIPDEEEEEYPFSKYKFNKKPDKGSALGNLTRSMSIQSNESCRFSDIFTCATEAAQPQPHGIFRALSFSSDASTYWDSSAPSMSSFLTSNTSNASTGSHELNKTKMFSIDSTPVAPSTPPESAAQFAPYNAEKMLSDLGFSGSDTFIPERFLRDWYNKRVKTDFESNNVAQMHSYGSGLNVSPTINARPPSFSEYNYHKPTDKHIQTSSRNPVSVHDSVIQDVPLPTRPGLVGREHYKHLRDYLESVAVPLQGIDIPPTKKRKQWANSRQKSLPLCLETLSEDDEGRVRMTGSRKLEELHHRKDAEIYYRRQEELHRRKGEPHRKEEIHHKKKEDFRHKKQDSFSSVISSHDSRSTSSGSYSSAFCATNEDTSSTSDSKSSKLGDLDAWCKPKLHSHQRQYAHPYAHHPNRTQGHPYLAIHSGKQDSVVSKSSLEVADIMQNSESQPVVNKSVEPAMVSIILHDVDGNVTKDRLPESSQFLSVSHSLDQPSDLLNVYMSRSPSMSSSPIPVSPITVIEVGLDNANDSLDVDDTDNFLKLHEALERRHSTGGLQKMHEQAKALKLQKRRNSLISRKEICDTDIIKGPSMDCMLEEPADHFLMFGNQAIRSTDSDSTCSKDVFVQADDGRLSPIIEFSKDDNFSIDDDEFYIAINCAIQCDLLPVSTELTNAHNVTMVDKCIQVNLIHITKTCLGEINLNRQYLDEASHARVGDVDISSQISNGKAKSLRHAEKTTFSAAVNTENDLFKHECSHIQDDLSSKTNTEQITMDSSVKSVSFSEVHQNRLTGLNRSASGTESSAMHLSDGRNDMSTSVKPASPAKLQFHFDNVDLKLKFKEMFQLNKTLSGESGEYTNTEPIIDKTNSKRNSPIKSDYFKVERVPHSGKLFYEEFQKPDLPQTLLEDTHHSTDTQQQFHSNSGALKLDDNQLSHKSKDIFEHSSTDLIDEPVGSNSSITWIKTSDSHPANDKDMSSFSVPSYRCSEQEHRTSLVSRNFSDLQLPRSSKSPTYSLRKLTQPEFDHGPVTHSERHSHSSNDMDDEFHDVFLLTRTDAASAPPSPAISLQDVDSLFSSHSTEDFTSWADSGHLSVRHLPMTRPQSPLPKQLSEGENSSFYSVSSFPFNSTEKKNILPDDSVQNLDNSFVLVTSEIKENMLLHGLKHSSSQCAEEDISNTFHQQKQDMFDLSEEQSLQCESHSPFVMVLSRDSSHEQQDLVVSNSNTINKSDRQFNDGVTKNISLKKNTSENNDFLSVSTITGNKSNSPLRYSDPESDFEEISCVDLQGITETDDRQKVPKIFVKKDSGSRFDELNLTSNVNILPARVGVENHYNAELVNHDHVMLMNNSSAYFKPVCADSPPSSFTHSLDIDQEVINSMQHLTLIGRTRSASWAPNVIRVPIPLKRYSEPLFHSSNEIYTKPISTGSPLQSPSPSILSENSSFRYPLKREKLFCSDSLDHSFVEPVNKFCSLPLPIKLINKAEQFDDKLQPFTTNKDKNKVFYKGDVHVKDAYVCDTSSEDKTNDLQFAEHVIQNPQFAEHVIQNPQFAEHVIQNPQFAEHVIQNPPMLNVLHLHGDVHVKDAHVCDTSSEDKTKDLQFAEHVIQNPQFAVHVIQNPPMSNVLHLHGDVHVKDAHVCDNSSEDKTKDLQFAEHVIQNPQFAEHVIQNPQFAEHVIQNPPMSNVLHLHGDEMFKNRAPLSKNKMPVMSSELLDINQGTVSKPSTKPQLEDDASHCNRTMNTTQETKTLLNLPCSVNKAQHVAHSTLNVRNSDNSSGSTNNNGKRFKSSLTLFISGSGNLKPVIISKTPSPISSNTILTGHTTTQTDCDISSQHLHDHDNAHLLQGKDKPYTFDVKINKSIDSIDRNSVAHSKESSRIDNDGSFLSRKVFQSVVDDKLNITRSNRSQVTNMSSKDHCHKSQPDLETNVPSKSHSFGFKNSESLQTHSIEDNSTHSVRVQGIQYEPMFVTKHVKQSSKKTKTHVLQEDSNDQNISTIAGSPLHHTEKTKHSEATVVTDHCGLQSLEAAQPTDQQRMTSLCYIQEPLHTKHITIQSNRKYSISDLDNVPLYTDFSHIPDQNKVVNNAESHYHETTQLREGKVSSSCSEVSSEMGKDGSRKVEGSVCTSEDDLSTWSWIDNEYNKLTSSSDISDLIFEHSQQELDSESLHLPQFNVTGKKTNLSTYNIVDSNALDNYELRKYNMNRSERNKSLVVLEMKQKFETGVVNNSRHTGLNTGDKKMNVGNMKNISVRNLANKFENY